MDKESFIEFLLSEVQALSGEVCRLSTRVGELEQRNDVLSAENAALRHENRFLRQEVDDLKSRLGGNSQNSHRPPSSDGYRKGNTKPAFDRKKGGKQGGQEGHDGHTLRRSATPDRVEECRPGQCQCGYCFTESDMCHCESRQVFDIPEPKLEVTEYRIFKGACPRCGAPAGGEAPEGVNAPAQYGRNIKALCVLLNVHYRIPYKKIVELMYSLYGHEVNESTITGAGEQCYRSLSQTEDKIKDMILSEPVLHADETGIRVEGALRWLHTQGTQLYTRLFVHEKRGREAMESQESVLPAYRGWMVHDCLGGYFHFENAHHAVCGAHLLRELQGLVESGKSARAGKFKNYLLSIYHMPPEERMADRQTIHDRYERFCRDAIESEPLPQYMPGKRGRPKRTGGRNLAERLMDKKEAVLAFAFNEEVPFSNNLAERDLRAAKVKQKVSNCFRTFHGAQIYARIESFISTAVKNDRNVFEQLRQSFDGKNFIKRISQYLPIRKKVITLDKNSCHELDKIFGRVP